jgi:flagellar motor switch protein FliM
MVTAWEPALSRELSQQEIDSLFREVHRGGEQAPAPKVAPFDFRRLDRIPKSQLRAIRLLHDNFVRNLASSLSAYLRTYLAVNLVSVEQLSYAEFLDGLASPTCLVCLGLHPYEGNAVLELNPNLTFPILELLLGGKGKGAGALSREITEIERQLMEGLLRIILKDLKDAWETITTIDFSVESMETEPQLLQVLDPGEAFVATGIEVRVGGALGMMNLAIPSLIIKMMRSKFDHPGGGRRSRASETEQARMLGLIRPAQLELDVRLRGPSFTLDDLLALEPGDLLPFDFPVARPLDCLVNGNLKFRGQVVKAGNKKAFLVEELTSPAA